MHNFQIKNLINFSRSNQIMQFQVTTHDINQIHHNNNLFI